MDNSKKSEILKKANTLFLEYIAEKHAEKISNLYSIEEFNYNPFMVGYLSGFLPGRNKSEKIAKALLYPRVLGTSITTTFGNFAQKFCREVLGGTASVTSGIDIEFVDFVDDRKKYCQIKAGPNTINSKDVTTVRDEFKAIKNLARTNGLDLRSTDMVVGVLYGSEMDLNSSYRAIENDYPIFVGQEFWFRLTGDQEFYSDLIKTLAETAKSLRGFEKLEEAVRSLAVDIEQNYPELLA